MAREVRFLSLQRLPINTTTILGVFFCAVFLSLIALYFEVGIRVDLFFLFFIPYWLMGAGGFIFSVALFLVGLFFAQHVGAFGISYLLFVLTTNLAVYNMRHNFFVLVFMFFLGETLFFVSYGIGVGIFFEQWLLIMKNIVIHILFFIPLAFLGSRYIVYEEQ